MGKTKTARRTFRINGANFFFDFEAFREQFRSYCLRSQPNTPLSKCEVVLAEKLHVSSGTVHGWRFYKNGPADLDTIRAIALEFGLGDYLSLLYSNDIQEKTEEMIIMELPVTERQRDSLKKIYDQIILFLDEYSITEGFNSYWSEYGDFEDEEKQPAIASKIYEQVNKKQHEIEIVLQQEFVVLHKLDIDELEDLIYEDLPILYQDQLCPDGRINARIRNDHTWTEVSWDVAEEYVRDRLNSIIFPFF